MNRNNARVPLPGRPVGAANVSAASAQMPANVPGQDGASGRSYSDLENGSGYAGGYRSSSCCGGCGWCKWLLALISLIITASAITGLILGAYAVDKINKADIDSLDSDSLDDLAKATAVALATAKAADAKAEQALAAGGIGPAIGILGDFSGPASTVGVDTFSCARATAAALGLTNVDLIPIDTGLGDDTAAVFADFVASNPGAIGVVGPLTSGQTARSKPIFKAAGLTQITSSATAVKVGGSTLVDGNGTLFRPIANNAAEATAAVQVLANENLGTSADPTLFIHDGSALAVDLLEQYCLALKAAGLDAGPAGDACATTVLPRLVNTADPGFEDFIRANEFSPAEYPVLFIVFDSQDAIGRQLNAAADPAFDGGHYGTGTQTVPNQAVLLADPGSDPAWIPVVLAKMPRAVQGVTTFTLSVDPADAPSFQPVLDARSALGYTSQPGGFCTSSSLASSVLIQAVSGCSGSDDLRACVRAAVGSNSFTSPLDGSSFSFKSSGEGNPATDVTTLVADCPVAGSPLPTPTGFCGLKPE